MEHAFVINLDPEAFEQIVEQYQKPVYNMCYRMLGNPQAAEDAAQESFWRAYKNMNRYDGKRKFDTWLLSIAAHYCIDQLRKKRVSSIDINEIIEFSAKDPAPNPESITIENEFSEEVQQQMSELNESDQAALILRYWFEMSEVEISETLNISKSAVKSRLHRARKHMAERWTTPQHGFVDERRHYETQSAIIPAANEEVIGNGYNTYNNLRNVVSATKLYNSF